MTGSYAYHDADHQRIALARLRLLRGRTIEQVDRIHAAALAAAVPPHGRCSMRLRDRRYLEPLLAEMARYEVPPVESADGVAYASIGGEHMLRAAV